jgi:hypothetical protein
MNRSGGMFEGHLPEIPAQHHMPLGCAFTHDEHESCPCGPELVSGGGLRWYQHRLVSAHPIPNTVPESWG